MSFAASIAMRALAFATVCLLACAASAQRAVYQGVASVEIVRAADVPELQIRTWTLPLPAFTFRQAYTFRDLPEFTLRIS